MTVSVRGASAPADADAIAQLLGQLGYDVAPMDVAARLSRILAKRDHRFVVADAGGTPVGWLHASLSEHIDAETCVLIEGLVVDRAHRGLGIGRTLLAHAEEWARAAGCSLIRLRSTDTRTEAHGFYEHLGYVRIKTQSSYAKPLDAAASARLGALVPRVDA